MILVLIALLALLALIYGPQVWVRRVMRRHGRELPQLPGTGGELARHLIERFELTGVAVEETESLGDHYDPEARAVRLGRENYRGKSLTAVAVAAHEVGHAMQFHRAEPLSRLRMRYLPAAIRLKKLGIGLLMALPLVVVLLRVPQAALLMAAVAVLVQLASVVMYLIILPEEWDASFNKALPILVDGGYVDRDQIGAVRQVLRAAALTYVAGALADMLNLARWLAILRR